MPFRTWALNPRAAGPAGLSPWLGLGTVSQFSPGAGASTNRAVPKLIATKNVDLLASRLTGRSRAE